VKCFSNFSSLKGGSRSPPGGRSASEKGRRAGTVAVRESLTNDDSSIQNHDPRKQR
jgi:hypothetical protein